MTGNALDVYMDGQLCGQLRESPQGNIMFGYYEGYLEAEGTPLSLSMRTAGSPGRSKATRAFFWGLLPDNPATLQAWANRYQTSPNNVIGLLRHVGMDTAGALQLVPQDTDPTDVGQRRSNDYKGDIEWYSTSALSKVVTEVAQNETDWNGINHVGRWSLAGAQSKVALFFDGKRWGRPKDATPTTHILKPANSSYPGHEVNEYLCQRAAAHVGLNAARAEILTLESGLNVYVVERYDRIQNADGSWRRIHQEDLCQAMSVMPSKKYQNDGGPGIGKIADLLDTIPSNNDRELSRDFFEQVVFNVLIGATDAHAKNYSLLHLKQASSIAPLYDTATGIPYYDPNEIQSAMKIADEWVLRSIGISHLAKVGSRLGLGSDEARAIAEDIREAIPEAFHLAAQEAPEALRPAAVDIARLVEAHVTGQRNYWTSSMHDGDGKDLSEASRASRSKAAVWVAPQQRADGTHVRGHWRSN